MMISLLLSRVLGLVRDMVMAHMFGVDVTTDAYRLAFQVPDLLFFLIAGGALSSAFIPVFSEYLHTEREREAWHVFSAVTTIMASIVGAFIVVAWIFARPLSMFVAMGKADDPAVIDLITQMSRIVLPAQFAFFIGGIMFGTLYARQVFAVPGLGPNVYNIGIILGAVLISQFMHPGVIGMSWGALLGAFVGNILIPLWAMRRIGVQYRVTFDTKHPGVRKVFRLMLPVVLGLSLPGVYALIMQWFASFERTGVNSWIMYSNQLMQAPLGVFGQSLAIAVFPALSQFFAQGNMEMYRTQLASTLRTVIYLALPVSALFAVAAPQIVAALYQGGRFSPEDTQQVANLLRWFAIGIPAWCMHPVLMRGFFAVQNTVTPVVLGTLTTFLFVLLVLLLRETPLSFYALPLASSISAIGLVLVMLVAVRKQIGGLDFAGIFSTLGKSLLGAAAFAGVTGAVLLTPLGAATAENRLMGLLFILLVALPGAWLYYFVTKWLAMPEAQTITRAMNRLGPIAGRNGKSE
jgi:putative peptidoglycan lipid II flippase